jgi:hypothetical protein
MRLYIISRGCSRAEKIHYSSQGEISLEYEANVDAWYLKPVHNLSQVIFASEDVGLVISISNFVDLG